MSFWKKKNLESPASTVKQNSDNKHNDGPNKEGNRSITAAKPDTASASVAQPDIKASTQPGSITNGNKPEPSNGISTAQDSFLNKDNGLSKVRSALSAGTVIQGKLSFDTPVRIDGKLSGEVYSSKVLVIGETAQINATIEASSLVIMGQVKGTIKASEKVELASGSKVEGDITSPALIIESGAFFNGRSVMKGAADQKGKETRIFADEKVDLGDMLETSSKNGKSKEDDKGLPANPA